MATISDLAIQDLRPIIPWQVPLLLSEIRKTLIDSHLKFWIAFSNSRIKGSNLVASAVPQPLHNALVQSEEWKESVQITDVPPCGAVLLRIRHPATQRQMRCSRSMYQFVCEFPVNVLLLSSAGIWSGEGDGV
jgi:hypothetical protein